MSDTKIPDPRPRNPTVGMREFLALVARVDELEASVKSIEDTPALETAETDDVETEGVEVTEKKAKRGRPPKSEE